VNKTRADHTTSLFRTPSTSSSLYVKPEKPPLILALMQLMLKKRRLRTQ